MCVYGLSGSEYCLAKPKSQIFSSPLLLTSTLLVFKSLCKTQLSCR